MHKKISKKEIEELKSVLRYDPNEGNFYWLKTINSRAIKDCVAGYNPSQGYRTVNYNKIKYKQHRLAFLFMTGKFPENEVDHKNRIKNDNRWCNLREATSNQNHQNSIKNLKNKTSKYRGVNLDRDKYSVFIKKDGISKYLGRFNTEKEAALAYDKKAKELHGDFAILNFPEPQKIAI